MHETHADKIERLVQDEIRRLGPAVRGIPLGNLVRSIAEALGIKACGGCAERQNSLNRFRVRI